MSCKVFGYLFVLLNSWSQQLWLCSCFWKSVKYFPLHLFHLLSNAGRDLLHVHICICCIIFLLCHSCHSGCILTYSQNFKQWSIFTSVCIRLMGLLIALGKITLLHAPLCRHSTHICWFKHLGIAKRLLTICYLVGSDGFATGRIWSAQTFCEGFAWWMTQWNEFSFLVQKPF